MSPMCTIVVPATSANIGPCFDAAGIALDRYLTLTIEKSNVWEFIHHGEHRPSITHYKDHFIYKVALNISRKHKVKMHPCRITVYSDIPLARGLGSSASAVLAGIEVVNQIAHLRLTTDEKLTYATRFEGHPDNVAPALLGGIVVSTPMQDQSIRYQRIPNEHLRVVIAIPGMKLRTEEARNALPFTYPRERATRASSISNVMIAALLAENYTLAGDMMEEDLFHEPYRSSLIPHYEIIRKKAKEYGAYGTVISGAGPTMIVFTAKEKQEFITEGLRELLPSYEVHGHSIDNNGVQIIKGE